MYFSEIRKKLKPLFENFSINTIFPSREKRRSSSSDNKKK